MRFLEIVIKLQTFLCMACSATYVFGYFLNIKVSIDALIFNILILIYLEIVHLKEKHEDSEK